MTSILSGKTPVSQEILDKFFPVIHASQLTLSDKYLRYKPENDSEANFRNYLIQLIKSGEVRDFRAQTMDPSLDELGNIIYSQGTPTASGKSAMWWKKNAAEFLPEFGIRLGTLPQHAIFLATLMNSMVSKNNYPAEFVWHLVCTNSSCLGYYSEPLATWCKVKPPVTGRLPFLGTWYDLASMRKIVVLDDNSCMFYQVSGSYLNSGRSHPLSREEVVLYPDAPCPCATGWVTMPANINVSCPILHHLG